MRKTTVNELINLNKELDKTQFILLHDNQFKRESEEQKIKDYINLLKDKISSLKGQRNINRLSKIKGKWERILFEKLPKFERFTPEQFNKIDLEVEEKSIEKFFEKVEQRIISMTRNLIPERDRINPKLFEDYI